MQLYYYINAKNEMDGPHDLVTMMRRIRSGAISPSTKVYREGEEPIYAHTIEELAGFFNNPSQDLRGDLLKTTQVLIASTLSIGWDFVAENQTVMVLAGAMLALCALFGILVNEIAGIPTAIAAAFVAFSMLQSYFFATALRLYRGQRTDVDFIEKNLSPVASKLAIISVIFSVIMPIGAVFLIIPAAFFMLVFMLSSMIMLDYRCGIWGAIAMARKLLAKLDNTSKIKLIFLILLYMIFSVLIFPIPLLLPILVGGMCKTYEELANA